MSLFSLFLSLTGCERPDYVLKALYICFFGKLEIQFNNYESTQLQKPTLEPNSYMDVHMNNLIALRGDLEQKTWWSQNWKWLKNIHSYRITTWKNLNRLVRAPGKKVLNYEKKRRRVYCKNMEENVLIFVSLLIANSISAAFV